MTTKQLQERIEYKEAMHAAWLRRLDWINENVIGPPSATACYTVEQLEAQGMIGIYAHPDKES